MVNQLKSAKGKKEDLIVVKLYYHEEDQYVLDEFTEFIKSMGVTYWIGGIKLLMKIKGAFEGHNNLQEQINEINSKITRMESEPEEETHLGMGGGVQ